MTRILVVEDHLIVREALVTLLTVKPDFQIVGVAASVRETKPLLEKTRPDVLLLDLSLEDGSGLELARMLRRSRSITRVLILTGFRDGFAAAEAMTAGVAGYVLKEQPTADLFAAIDIVRRGGTYVCPTIVAQLKPDQLSPKEDDLLASLSRRESEIFRLIVAGASSRDLSRRLFISAKTVDTHRTNIGRKLGVRTSADLVRFAAAHGIAIAPHAAQDDSGVGAGGAR
ncbi:MAG TPA: response regulator transcription factor [Polyangia bacterium]|nr:response regulator transcription factor [Polyangia bacterium]